MVARKRCLNGATIPAQGPTPDAKLDAMGSNRLASSVHPCFTEASPTVEKAVSCYRAWWAVTQRTLKKHKTVKIWRWVLARDNTVQNPLYSNTFYISSTDIKCICLLYSVTSEVLHLSPGPLTPPSSAKRFASKKIAEKHMNIYWNITR